MKYEVIETAIPINVGLMSTMTVSGEYPFEHGNYFTTTDETGEYAIHNMNLENFLYYKSQGCFTDGKMLAYVVQTGDKRFACHIIDTRIKVEDRKEDNLYNGCCAIKVAPLQSAMVAMRLDITKNCICDVFKDDAVYWYMRSQDSQHGRCICCDKKFSKVL